MSKAACLAIILAYATEEGAVYWKRKRSIWTKEILTRILYLQFMWHFEKKMRTVWESMMNCWCGTTTRKHVHTHFRLSHYLLAVQRNSNLFEKYQTVAQSNHTKHDQTVCVAACVVQTVWPCVGPLTETEDCFLHYYLKWNVQNGY